MLKNRSLKREVTSYILMFLVAISLGLLVNGMINMHNNYDQLKKDFSKLQDVHNQVMKNSEELLYKVEDLEGEIEEYESINEELSEEIDELEEKKSEYEEEVSELEDKLSKQEQEEARIASLSQTKETNSNSSGDWMDFTATWYTAFCDTGCVGITRSGYDVSNTIYSPSGNRVIAVDPNVIPLHSLVEVELPNGNRFKAKALDTGGAIQGRIIDILTTDTETAFRNGRQNVKVRVLDRG